MSPSAFFYFLIGHHVFMNAVVLFLTLSVLTFTVFMFSIELRKYIFVNIKVSISLLILFTLLLAFRTARKINQEKTEESL